MVEFRFIVGATSSDDWRYLAEEEQRVFGDLVFLHEEENMNREFCLRRNWEGGT